MNEPKQITEEEAIKKYCNEVACNCREERIDETSGEHPCKGKFCGDLVRFLSLCKENGWIKPDPTPEEKFIREADYMFHNLSRGSFIDWVTPAIEKLAAEIRAERDK